MGTIRKFNKETNKWEVIATSDANTTSVRSEQLLPPGKTETNVEQVLIDMNDKMTTMEGNINWLALHGGGGSGGSGGGNASAEITVNGKKDGEKIIFNDEEGLTIKVLSSSSLLKWKISASCNGKVIATTRDAVVLKITKEDLDNSNIDKSFLLAVTAENMDTLTQVFWNGEVVIPSVHLGVTDIFNCKREDYKQYSLSYTYDVAVHAIYQLIANDKKVWEGKIETNSGNIEVPLEIILGNDPSAGAQDVISYLVHIDNPAIKSKPTKTTIVLNTDVPVISCTVLSEDINNPTKQFVRKGANSIILVPFTVYFEEGSYKSIIHSSLDPEVQDSDFNDLNYKLYNTLYDNESCSILWDGEYGEVLSITISIYDGINRYDKTYYIETAEQEYSFLETGKERNLLFDFNSIFGKLEQDDWVEENKAILHVNNSNDFSSAIDKNTGSIRLQNTSYITINSLNGFSFRNSLQRAGAPEFTLCLSYKCDFHSGNNRTVLQWANQGTDSEGNLLITGIVIKDHQLFIGNSYVDLEDDEQINITITFHSREINNPVGTLFIYINGVLETAYETSFYDLFGNNNAAIEDTIYIGAGHFNLD